MARQTKNVITLDSLKKELRHTNVADMKYGAVLLTVFTPFLLCVVALLLYGGFEFFEWYYYIIIGVPVAMVPLIPVFGFARWIVTARKRNAMLDRDELDVRVLPLKHKGEKIVHRHLEEYLRFDGYRDYTVSHTVYELAAAGDEYYVVSYRDGSGEREEFVPEYEKPVKRKKRNIALIYPLKMYEYKEK